MELDKRLARGIDLQTETNTFDVKKEVIDNDYCQHMYIQHNHEICSNSNYSDTGISDIHVASVKSEPEDEPPRTSDHSKFLIEIDTCKDEYYEKHGYPSYTAIDVKLEEGGVEEESAEDYVAKEDMYMKHSDTSHKRLAPHTYVDPKPCTVVLSDIQYTYPDIVTRGYVHVHDKGPTIQIHTQSTQYVHDLHQSKHKPYRCSVCGVDYTLKRNMKTRMRIHTGEKPHKCSVCEVCFREKGHLASHMRTHTGEKPYTCPVCRVGFTLKGNIHTHMRIHTGEKPHKCYVCEVSFPQTSDLTKHMRIHTGEKPYKCSVCGVAFSQKASMNKHMIIHTGEKPHTCSVCEVGFTQKGHLMQHMRIHTGEKPYKCSVCGIAFMYQYNMKRHTRIHTGQKPHDCYVCEASFMRKRHLTRHLHMHAGE